MTILASEDGIKGRLDAPQQQREVIYTQEITQTSQLTTQTGNLTGDKPVSDSFVVNEKPNNENLFDLSLLEEMDDNEYVSDILTIFLGNTPKELYELKRACVSNNFDAAYKMAHKIKGSAGLLQATTLLNVLTKIEGTAKGEKNDGLAKLAELAYQEYKKTETPLKEHLRDIQGKLRVGI